MKPINRKAFVAGKFYPDNKLDLERMLENLYETAISNKGDDVLALIVPHAGYIYSGEVAASGFSQLDLTKTYDNIFIIGTSHRASFEGAVVYTSGNFETLLGEVEVNIEICNNLIKSCKYFISGDDIHWYEHSLEVQLPFLQYKLNKKYKIVPVLIGAQNEETIKNIADALKIYFGGNNLFIISTDFSHYPNANDANLVDNIIATTICTNQPKTLIKEINRIENLKINNLSTSLCGWSAVYTLLCITSNYSDVSIKKIQYMNSAQVFGETDRVVGYWSIAITKK